MRYIPSCYQAVFEHLIYTTMAEFHFNDVHGASADMGKLHSGAMSGGVNPGPGPAKGGNAPRKGGGTHPFDGRQGYMTPNSPGVPGSSAVSDPATAEASPEQVRRRVDSANFSKQMDDTWSGINGNRPFGTDAQGGKYQAGNDGMPVQAPTGPAPDMPGISPKTPGIAPSTEDDQKK